MSVEPGTFELDIETKNRKKAQKYLLAEHLCNTLADRMWLYAAGLLLMEAVSRIDPEISQITTSSMYGLILSATKVTLSPTIGSIVEKTSRLKGAMVPLIIQNTSVAISAILLTVILMDGGLDMPVWAVFTIVTFFSCIAILASVGLMNVISRDWVVEISENDELTSMNAWLRSIDQATLVLSAGLSGFTIALNQAIGAITIAGLNIVAMVFQAICLYQIHKLVPKLGKKKPRPSVTSETFGEKAKQKVKIFFDGWVLLAKSKVVVPGLVLGILYINILGMSFPLQGYGRESCLSEATISILFIASAVTGFVAPISFPYLTRTLGLIGTGLGGCIWQIGFLLVGVVGLFLPGSPYIYYQEDQQCSPMNATTYADDTFWIRCPPGVTPPTSYMSIGVIFASAIFQRWGVYIFDMITTQLFQLEVTEDKRNRVSAGQYSLNAVFEIALYGLSLIWSTACLFGNAILLSNAFILGGYCIYIVWACTYTNVDMDDGKVVRMPRIKSFNLPKSTNTKTKVAGELTVL